MESVCKKKAKRTLGVGGYWYQGIKVFLFIGIARRYFLLITFVNDPSNIIFEGFFSLFGLVWFFNLSMLRDSSSVVWADMSRKNLQTELSPSVIKIEQLSEHRDSSLYLKWYQDILSSFCFRPEKELLHPKTCSVFLPIFFGLRKLSYLSFQTVTCEEDCSFSLWISQCIVSSCIN